MSQTLYALVRSDTGKVASGTSKGKLGVFKSEKTARTNAWRYGCRDDNFKIIPYEPVPFGKKVVDGWY